MGMLFKLKEKCGNHRAGNKTYKPGSQIKSDLDLVKLFPEKFELVTIPVQTTDVVPPNIPVPENDETDETDETEKFEATEATVSPSLDDESLDEFSNNESSDDKK